MRFEVIGFAIRVYLKQGESVKLENDAMVSRTREIEILDKVDGGLLGALSRRFAAKENSFFQTLVAHQDGHAVFAPTQLGAIHIFDIEADKKILFRKNAFLCADNTVLLTTAAHNSFMGTLFRGQSFFLLCASGFGKLALNAVGSSLEYNLKQGERLIVDNRHVIAFSKDIQWNLGQQEQTFFGSLSSADLDCFFEGPGVVIVQTHNTDLMNKISKRKETDQKQSNGIGTPMCFLLVCVLLLCVFTIILIKRYTYASMHIPNRIKKHEL